MINERGIFNVETIIRDAFDAAEIAISSLEQRSFPDEIIYVVKVVGDDEFRRGSEIGNSLDLEIQNAGVKGFVTVRKADADEPKQEKPTATGVGNPKATDLISLLNSRSRASELQPSLSYVPDTAFNIRTVSGNRHHLIFGRRGVGKTALMVEAKRLVTEAGHASVWINLQTLRKETVARAYCVILQRVCDSMQIHFGCKSLPPTVLSHILELNEQLDRALLQDEVSDKLMGRLIPRAQRVIRRFVETAACQLFLFIDELHYFNRTDQPALLDALHGSVRDCNAWLKIAGIRHLSRWFQPHPPLGLQTGHDADHVDLDITLENPSKAKTFLERILASYARSAGIPSLSGLIIGNALDRLVLASGAVPRDYLVLCGGAIRQAQRRVKARLIGVEDINKAAGEAAKVKLTELEDDTSGTTRARDLVGKLNSVRAFCLEEKKFTFFRIEFADKETHPIEYSYIQDLMDLRLVHLIDASLSDQHAAGNRSEVYMLDLSQFSGQRLKKNLKALDFSNGHLVLKETGTAAVAKVGARPTDRIGILRRGPVFQLSRLADVPI